MSSLFSNEIKNIFFSKAKHSSFLYLSSSVIIFSCSLSLIILKCVKVDSGSQLSLLRMQIDGLLSTVYQTLELYMYPTITYGLISRFRGRGTLTQNRKLSSIAHIESEQLPSRAANLCQCSDQAIWVTIASLFESYWSVEIFRISQNWRSRSMMSVEGKSTVMNILLDGEQYDCPTRRFICMNLSKRYRFSSNLSRSSNTFPITSGAVIFFFIFSGTSKERGYNFQVKRISWLQVGIFSVIIVEISRKVTSWCLQAMQISWKSRKSPQVRQKSSSWLGLSIFLKILRKVVILKVGCFFIILSIFIRSFSVSLSTIFSPVNSVMSGCLVI